MDLNKAMIIGNLTRDPEIRTTPSGQTVAKFGIATNLIWTDQSGQKQQKVEFHNIVAWRKLADICGQYLHKGAKIYIEGRLQTSNWVGQDNVKRYRTEIIADNMIMLSGSNTGSNTNNSNYQNISTGQGSQPNPSPSEPVINVEEPVQTNDNPVEEEIKVENIPF